MSVNTRAFEPADTEAVVALWEACGLTRPWNDPRADIARKLRVQPELFRVAVDDSTGDTVGSVMAGYDGHRGWAYYLATAPTHRGRGIAAALMREVEGMLEELGCPKSQLMVRNDNVEALSFYDRLNYEIADVRVLGRRLIED
ncbi:GNAT family acetyltransferase [Leucobacter coleopterorum]|uniref:GNAT family acetyltransferase n=1 Tax=Leucobacter coleopterorum TaxID=2714933 RepID=A0ABX6JWX7_9MICO|nr:GNAT family acetyltransferase [Leucobacter coleopterorum]QIM18806.1 GNAT family acetyltransferase [Leucobacter coleopterorum]